MEKLHWDLPHLQYDDVLFSHTVDEALGFARELKDGYGYPDDQPNVYSVLVKPDFFIKWINLEKKCKSIFKQLLFHYFSYRQLGKIGRDFKFRVRF